VIRWLQEPVTVGRYFVVMGLIAIGSTAMRFALWVFA
jgi:hypothetical protein